MNKTSMDDLRTRSALRVRLLLRVMGRRRARSFGTSPGSIGRIRVINLDRQPRRWRQVSAELARWRTVSGEPLATITRRLSAVDARDPGLAPDPGDLVASYLLSEQLLVEPNPLLRLADAGNVTVQMSRQEVAVALSHLRAWRDTIAGDEAYVLVLEDDVFFERSFARRMDRAWTDIRAATRPPAAAFDLLFVSYKEVGGPAGPGRRTRSSHRRPTRGLWQASGYVLSRDGAWALLDRLPAHGPVDLWLNLQFDGLRVLLLDRPLVSQRPGLPSDNSYSIMPVLSRLGVVRDERAHLPPRTRLAGPVFAFGPQGTGLTSLALALSMLGYTCLSDVEELPEADETLLRSGKRGAFDAFVNVGGLDEAAVADLARRWPHAKVVLTGAGARVAHTPTNVLRLPAGDGDRWAALSRFLSVGYPVHEYPDVPDLGLRALVRVNDPVRPDRAAAWDTTPWVSRVGHGLGRKDGRATPAAPGTRTSRLLDGLGAGTWAARDDTFPGNLSLFSKTNVTVGDEGVVLSARAEDVVVRDSTAGALATIHKHLYGRFSAELRPAAGAGLVTGMFLHRNGPRQEIDVELLGRDPTRLLANVYYNPGPAGTRLEYGYRGTPVMVDLGFDASLAIHLYEICWEPDAIRWLVDGRVVHERFHWDPTPIPDQPLEFNVNLWHSASKELAGVLHPEALPARTVVREAWIGGWTRSAEATHRER